MNFETAKQRTRLSMILARHAYAEDQKLSDDEFVRMVFARYERSRCEALIDPAE